MTTKKPKTSTGEPDRLVVQLDVEIPNRIGITVTDCRRTAALEKVLSRAGRYENPEPGRYELDADVFRTRVGWFHPATG